MKYVNSSGNVFVFGGYRKVVAVKNRASLVKSLAEDRESHGDFIGITDKKRNEGIAVIGKYSGISAGEFIRAKLLETFEGEYKNIIYLEASDEVNGETLVVVLHNGKVELDTIISSDLNTIEVELALSAIESFTLILCGVDIKEVAYIADSGKLSNIIDSCPSFFADKVSANYLQLLSMDDALKAAGFKKSNSGIFIGLMILIALGVSGYYFYTDQQKKKAKKVSAVVDPFINYKADIKLLPSPISTVNTSLDLLYKASKVDGWGFESIQVNRDSSFSIVFSAQGGSYDDVNVAFKAINGLSIQLKGADILISGSLTPQIRSFPYVIYSLPKIEADVFKSFVVEGNYKLLTVTDIDKNFYITRQYELTIQNSSSIDFDKMAETFLDKPVVVNSINIKPSDVGFDLVVSFLIFGAKN